MLGLSLGLALGNQGALGVPPAIGFAVTDERVNSGGANVTSVDFAAVDIGEADADRELYIQFAYFSGSVADPFTVEVGGITATNLVTQVDDNILGTGIAKIAIPTGTLPTVTLRAGSNESISAGRCAIKVLRVVKAGGTSLVDTAASGGAQAMPLDLDTSLDGLVIAGVYENTSGNADNIAWAGATQRGTNADIQSGDWVSMAVSTTQSAETPRAVSVDTGNAVARSGAVAVSIV
jgi:hypothetical protein